MSDIDEELLSSVFEVQAEFLSKTELTRWTATTTRDKAVLSRLKGPGAKLLIGPRGSGKSTLLRQAYLEMHEERKDLAVYVNYSRSLALEPLFHRAANALQLFRQWVQVKIILGVRDAMKDDGIELPDSLTQWVNPGLAFVHDLESGNDPAAPENFVAPSQLLAC